MLIVAAWQGLQNDSISAGNTRLLMIFVGIVALSMAAQAVVVIFLAIEAKKVQKRLLVIVEELRGRAIPIIDVAENVIKDSVPKVRTVTDNLVTASKIVREQAEKYNLTLTDVNTRAKAQVVRVDGMVSTALTATGALAEMIHRGIKTPVTEIVGVVNGVKAGIDVLVNRSGTGMGKRKPAAVVAAKGDGAGI